MVGATRSVKTGLAHPPTRSDSCSQLLEVLLDCGLARQAVTSRRVNTNHPATTNIAEMP